VFPLIFTVDENVAAPVTPIPPAWTNKVDASVATPETDNVEEAVNAPDDVNEVWKVEAPVIPTPPEVTSKAAECEATPENVEVDPNTAAPDTPKPVPAFIFPDTPKPPTRVTAPLLEEVEFVFELNTAAPLTVNPPVTPRPPEVISNEVLKDFTPAKVCADVVTSPISPTLALGILNVCVEVTDEILNELPPVPTANVCVVVERLLRDVIPDVPAPAPVPQDKLPVPSVVRTCPFVPSDAGKDQILLVDKAGALNPT
jgi:hypothetical protein